jgi:hypothetical protein
VTPLRFTRWLQRDDPAKENVLYAIDAGASDAEACEQVGIGTATLRAWMGLDRDFAEAVRIARRGELGEVHCWNFNALDAPPDPNAPPPPWSSVSEIERQGWGRLDDTSGVVGPEYGGGWR